MKVLSKIIGGVFVVIVWALVMSLFKKNMGYLNLPPQLGGILYAGFMTFFLILFVKVTGLDIWFKKR
jgi:hypothetical protein